MHRESQLTRAQVEQVDSRCAQRAAGQWSVFDAREAHACGLSDDAIRTRVQNGLLHPFYRGVYAWGHAKLSLEGCFLAAVKACGPDAVLSHFSAAALWRLLEWDYRDPEVTARNARKHAGINTTRATPSSARSTRASRSRLRCAR